MTVEEELSRALNAEDIFGWKTLARGRILTTPLPPIFRVQVSIHIQTRQYMYFGHSNLQTVAVSTLSDTQIV